MELSDLLVGATITDFRWARGFRFIPDWVIVSFEKKGIEYSFEAEIDFRIVNNGERIFCFGDMGINRKYNTLSMRKYRALKDDISCTLMSEDIELACNAVLNKKIKKVIVKKYGDVFIYLSSNLFMHCINNQNINSDKCVFRLYRIIEDKISNETINIEGSLDDEQIYYYEIYNDKNSTIIVNNLSKIAK